MRELKKNTSLKLTLLEVEYFLLIEMRVLPYSTKKRLIKIDSQMPG